MINFKNKGTANELRFLKKINELYNKQHFTTRNSNRMLDAKKVDIQTDHFNIQCKSTANNINYSKLMKEIDLCNKDDDRINIIQSKVTHKGNYIILKEGDFLNIIRNYLNDNE